MGGELDTGNAFRYRPRNLEQSESNLRGLDSAFVLRS
jgi:hypothetical protein